MAWRFGFIKGAEPRARYTEYKQCTWPLCKARGEHPLMDHLLCTHHFQVFCERLAEMIETKDRQGE